MSLRAECSIALSLDTCGGGHASSERRQAREDYDAHNARDDYHKRAVSVPLNVGAGLSEELDELPKVALRQRCVDCVCMMLVIVVEAPGERYQARIAASSFHVALGEGNPGCE